MIWADIREHIIDKSESHGGEIMQYAIELYYDEDTENKLFQLSEGIADKKSAQSFWSGRQGRILL